MKNPRQQRFGELNGNAKLTAELAREIRQSVQARDEFRRRAARLKAEAKQAREAAALLSNERIAQRLGITRWAVRDVIYQDTWRHVR